MFIRALIWGSVLFGRFSIASPLDLKGFSELEKMETALKAARSPAQRSALLMTSDALTSRTAQQLVEAYVGGKWGAIFFSRWRTWCHREGSIYRYLNCAGLNRKIPLALYEASMARLRTFQDPRMKSLIAWADKAEVGDKMIFDSDGPAAGVDRGKHFVFVNAEKIPSDQWLLYFIHEVVHFIDPTLREAVLSFNQFMENWSELNIPAITEGVRNGLDRGLLAEWRAWYCALLFYRDGRERGLWTNFPWMDRVLDESPPGQLGLTLFRELKTNFPDPDVEPFTLPVFARPLAEVHAKLEKGEGLELGPLEKIFPNEFRLPTRR